MHPVQILRMILWSISRLLRSRASILAWAEFVSPAVPVARPDDTAVVAPEVVGAVGPGARLGFCPRVAEPPEVGAEGLVALDPGPDEAGAEGLVVNPDPGRADGTADEFGKAVDDPELSLPEVVAPEPRPPVEVPVEPIPVEEVD